MQFLYPPTGLLPPSTGLGARVTADMEGKRPLCAMGPMMSALILRFLLIKEKEQKRFASLLLFTAPPRQSHFVVTRGWFSSFYKQTELHVICINSLDVNFGYKDKSFSLNCFVKRKKTASPVKGASRNASSIERTQHIRTAATTERARAKVADAASRPLDKPGTQRLPSHLPMPLPVAATPCRSAALGLPALLTTAPHG